MKALVIGGNECIYNYPSQCLSGEDSVGDALLTIGLDTSYCGIKILFNNLFIMDDVSILAIELTGLTILMDNLEHIFEYAISNNKLILGMNEGDAALPELLNMEFRERYINLLKKCSLVITNSIQTLQCLESWVRCYFIGLPYNIQSCLDNYDHDIPKEYIYNGVLYSYRIRMNNYSTIKLLTDHKLPLLMTYIDGMDNIDTLYNHLKNLCVDTDYITLVPHVYPKEFIKRDLSRSWLSINPQILASLGRLVADSVAIGIPCIGTHSGFQDFLYPELIYNGYSKNELFNLIEICKNKEKIKPIISKGQERLKKFYPKAWAINFLEILNNELGIFWFGNAADTRDHHNIE